MEKQAELEGGKRAHILKRHQTLLSARDRCSAFFFPRRQSQREPIQRAPSVFFSVKGSAASAHSCERKQQGHVF